MARPWPHPPQNLPKPMKNQCFALWSLLERPKSDVETPKQFWIHFPSIFKANLPPTWPQLGSQNPPKSLKNRCQDALYFALYFLIDFWSIFAPTLDPRISKNRAPAAGRARFNKNRLSKLTSIFDPILDSTLPHFGIQNPPKSFQKSIPRGTKKLINFGIDF